MFLIILYLKIFKLPNCPMHWQNLIRVDVIAHCMYLADAAKWCSCTSSTIPSLYIKGALNLMNVIRFQCFIGHMREQFQNVIIPNTCLSALCPKKSQRGKWYIWVEYYNKYKGDCGKGENDHNVMSYSFTKW